MAFRCARVGKAYDINEILKRFVTGFFTVSRHVARAAQAIEVAHGGRDFNIFRRHLRDVAGAA